MQKMNESELLAYVEDAERQIQQSSVVNTVLSTMNQDIHKTRRKRRLMVAMRRSRVLGSLFSKLHLI